MKKLLITGANGFIGAHLCKILSSQYDIRAVVRKPWKHRSVSDVVVIPDMMAYDQWQGLLTDIDIVIHLAARAHRTQEKKSSLQAIYYQENALLTQHLANQAARYKVKRFIFLSTIYVCGNKGVINEQTNAAPNDAYALSKWQAEQLLHQEQQQHPNMEILTIRPPLVYGKGVKGNMKRLLQLVHSSRVLPFAAAKAPRSFVALENLASLIQHCIDYKQCLSGQTLVVCDGEDMSIATLVRMVANLLDKKIWLVYVPACVFSPLLKLCGKHHLMDTLFKPMHVDMKYTQKLLSWKPVTSINQAIKNMTLS